MYMKEKLISVIIILIMISMVFYTPIVNASTSLDDNELLIMNGNTITKTTNISEINTMFGKPKIEGDSAFGGKAYTYYDDEYTWMLHIETDINGIIKGYGCVNGNFTSKKYAQGDKYTYKVSYMSGTVIYDDNDNVNGVYEYNVTSSDIQNYKTNFLSSSKYLYDLQKSSLIVSKILARKHNYQFPQTYIDEDIFYMNENLKYNNTDLYNWGKDTGKSKYISLVLSRTDYCDYELPNPLMLGKNTENYTRAENYKYVFYDMKVLDEQTFKIFTTITFVDPEFLNKKNEVSLTDNEMILLNNVKEKYKEYNTHGQAIVKNFDVEPQYKELPLVAGKWSDMALLMVTDYINLARTGLGLHPLNLNQNIADAAQHKAALVAYNSMKGYQSGHYPEQPEGVSDEFFNKAQSYMTENLYTGDIQSSIVSALNDGYGDPVQCGHRYNLLNPSATEWGAGAVGSGISWGWQGVHKFSGFEDFTNELVAWPSNGIFTMDLAYNGIGNWTARFYKNYNVTSDTEVTIKCLNSDKTYEITNENKNDSGKFLQVSGSDLITFRDDTIAYESGDVFEITLHNVIDKSTGNKIDYKYRSVFMSMSQINESNITDIELNKNTVNLTIGESNRILAKVIPEDATNKLIEFTSTNEDIATVRQDGTITGVKEGTTTITIKGDGVIKQINVTVDKYLKGDINQDGIVNAVDVSYGMRGIIHKIELTELEKEIGDVNKDGIFNVVDVNDIMRYVIGKKDNL